MFGSCETDRIQKIKTSSKNFIHLVLMATRQEKMCFFLPLGRRRCSGRKTIKCFLKYFIELASLLPTLRRKPLFTNLEFMENATQRILLSKRNWWTFEIF